MRIRIMKKMILVALALTYAFLCGCGTKGPLYIPEQRYPQGVPKAKPAEPTIQDRTQPNP
jgi:predicted small lipoprotein YifL